MRPLLTYLKSLERGQHSPEGHSFFKTYRDSIGDIYFLGAYTGEHSEAPVAGGSVVGI